MKQFSTHALIACCMLMFFSACYNEDNRIFPTCDDGIKNNEEERIDCGGPNCDPCPPSCDNGILDWFPEGDPTTNGEPWIEYGVDCGGACEAEGKFCYDNGIQDINPNDSTYSESWVDCRYDIYPPWHQNAGDPFPANELNVIGGSLPVGYPACDLCENGQHDATNGEFVSDINGLPIPVVDCDENGDFCEPCDLLCTDGLLNGAEGPCPDCGAGCLGGPCDLSHCEDGVQTDNGPNDPYTEEGIDCGACGCPECEELCNDGIFNGLEEALDCGGTGTPSCTACNDPVLCGDGIQNGYETGIDCFDDPTPEDLTDNSACPTCFTLCEDGIMNGYEIDTDCGSNNPDIQAGHPEYCGPCASDDIYFTYLVDGALYECVFETIQVDSIVDTEVPATFPEIVRIQGGMAHHFTIRLEDENVNPGFAMTYNGGPWVLNNAIMPPGSAEFVDVDGTSYNSSNGAGLTVVLTQIDWNPGIDGYVEGTFEGVLVDPLTGDQVNITEGAFRVNWYLNP